VGLAVTSRDASLLATAMFTTVVVDTTTTDLPSLPTKVMFTLPPMTAPRSITTGWNSSAQARIPRRPPPSKSKISASRLS
jgi:hypothetical protein